MMKSKDLTGYSELYSEAKEASEKWSPFVENHCPSFIAALKDAYYQGYVSGAYVASIKNDKTN